MVEGVEYLTADEAAEQLGVKRATLYAYASRGRLRSYRRGTGRARLYRADEIRSLPGSRPTGRPTTWSTPQAGWTATPEVPAGRFDHSHLRLLDCGACALRQHSPAGRRRGGRGAGRRAGGSSRSSSSCCSRRSLYSYVTTMLRPSSLPLSIRTVEWVRANHGAWFVDKVENWYYSWQAPSKGGPALRSLPRLVGADPPPAPTPAHPQGRRALPAAAGAARRSRPGARGRGRVAPGAALGAAPAPVLVRPSTGPIPSYPRVVAYVAWIDHTPTQLALYPGRYEPPAGSPRGPIEVPYGQRYRALATFNSGFTHGDGNGGFSVNGRTLRPLVRGFGNPRRATRTAG